VPLGQGLGAALEGEDLGLYVFLAIFTASVKFFAPLFQADRTALFQADNLRERVLAIVMVCGLFFLYSKKTQSRFNITGDIKHHFDFLPYK
jgi:hypothetical protein